MLRLLVMLVTVALVLLAVGCSGPKDQSEARLNEMPYTFENVAAEVINRYTVIKRGPRRSDGRESVIDEGRESDGPGGNPFTLESLAEDTLGKLLRVEAIPLPELLKELERRLSDDGSLKPEDVDVIMAELHAAAGDSTPTPPEVGSVGKQDSAMLDRRHFLQTGLGVAGALATAQAGPDAPDQTALRVAFLTDMHLPGDRSDVAARVAKLVTSIESRPQKPDMFVFGGDNVMAVDGQQTAEQVQAQFELWTETVASRLTTPFLSVIGNHDIWWKAPAAPGSDHPEKALATERYQMPHRFFSKVVGGWRFVMLDCFQSGGCELDDKQWKWLEQELHKSQEPVCIVSHAPILSVTHFFEPSTATEQGYVIPASWSPRGAVRFRELFRDHPHVKLALSGHMHTVDRVEVDHTAYISGGAVSGAWWGGDYYGFPPAWVELQLFPDGRWSHQLQPWT